MGSFWGSWGASGGLNTVVQRAFLCEIAPGGVPGGSWGGPGGVWNRVRGAAWGTVGGEISPPGAILGEFAPPKKPSRTVLLHHLSRMGELLNTLRNVHGGARAPRGAPRAPPGPPSGGGPRGGPGGVPDPLPGTPLRGVLWGGPPPSCRPDPASWVSGSAPTGEIYDRLVDDPAALSLAGDRCCCAPLVVSRVELHSMSRCMSSCIPCRVACRVAFSLWRSEDTTCPQLKPRLAGLVIANPNDVARRWWQSPPTPTLAPSCYGHELATSRSLTHA